MGGADLSALRIDAVTAFPSYFESALACGVLARAQERGALSVQVHDLRDYTHDRHRVVDDYPYGGGPGMVLKPEPFFEAVEALLEEEANRAEAPVVLLSASGRLLTPQWAQSVAAKGRLILLCGHYEGVDQRVADYLATEELSIGDYVLSGGEAGALVVMEVVGRFVPGVVSNAESLQEESFASEGYIEYPQYTRPAEYRGWGVPEVLLSGNHQEIRKWREAQARERGRLKVEGSKFKASGPVGANGPRGVEG